MHCERFSSIPGLCLPDASSISPSQVMMAKNVSRCYQMSGVGRAWGAPTPPGQEPLSDRVVLAKVTSDFSGTKSSGHF